MRMLWGVLLGVCSVSFAGDIVDVHGLGDLAAQKILQAYRPRIQALEMQMMSTFLNMSQGNPSTQD